MAVSASLPKQVNLTKYVRLAQGWRFCPVAVSSNGRVKPDRVLVNGDIETHPEGSYSIEWYDDHGKRRRLAVGKSAADAQAAKQRREQILASQALGIEVVDADGAGRVELADACSEFLEETQQNRRPKTYHQYRVALDYFQQCCKKKYLAEIERKDLINYVAFLRDHKALGQRTISTKLHVVLQMLRANGISGLMRKKDRPRYVEPEPEIYSPEELEKFFAACEPEERLLFECFLMTGLRERELEYLTWKDVDFSQHVVRVTAKPDLGFFPKDWEEREVPIPDRLAHALQQRKARASGNARFVFPASGGGANGHFLRQLKAIAYRAKLNCGNCDNGKQLCLSAPSCDQWFLHKFRATFATMHLQAGVDLRTVQHWMGHQDLASTMRYLKPARGKGVREKVNRTFAAV